MAVEELLRIEQRLEWELDGDRTRLGGASEPRCWLDWELVKSYAGDRESLFDVVVGLANVHGKLGPDGELGPELGADDCSYSANLQDSEQ